MAKKSSIPKFSQLDASDPMAKLLAKSSIKPRAYRQGEEVDGAVVALSGRTLTLDVGAKAEGLVIEREFEAAASYIKTLKPGDKVRARVVTGETPTGQILLSLRGEAERKGWELLEKAKKENTELEAKIESVTRGGLTAQVLGIQGFIPSSQAGVEVTSLGPNAVGKQIKVKVVDVDQAASRVVLSERAVSHSEEIAKAGEALKKIKKGEKFRGRVTSLVPFGAFVEIEREGTRLEGLVHLSEISWERTSEASEVLSEGEEVDVVALVPSGRGDGGNRLALSIRQTTENPWTRLVEKYKPEAKVSGTVTRVDGSTANVEIGPGVEGVIRKIPDGVSLVEGKIVDCLVESVDNKKHRLNLSVALTSKPVGYK